VQAEEELAGALNRACMSYDPLANERFAALAELHEEFGNRTQPQLEPVEAEPEWRPFAGGSAAHRPEGTIGWALGRYELGCERETVLDGLSDHLLALRALLEGGGIAGAGLPMRVAALCAEPEARLELRAMVERAQSLERRLMRGAPTDDSDERLALDLACHVRSILGAATSGKLGKDLRAAADDILVANAVSNAAPVADMGETSEWEPFAPDTGEQTQVMEVAVVTPIERAHEIRAESGEPGWRREYDAIQDRPHRRPQEFFPSPDTTEWSIGELQFSALRD
jgi:hypothetical protein